MLEQAKRCKWEEYTSEVAALDALLYQCPNQQWKDKIMEGTMNFQECIDWGMSKWAAKEQGKVIGDKLIKDATTLPTDKLEEKKLQDCKKCFQKHEFRNCPAWNQQCSKCQRWNHLANSRTRHHRVETAEAEEGGNREDNAAEDAATTEADGADLRT